MNTCLSTIPSLNISIKAQKELAKYGIYCKIVSLDPTVSHYGCAYGIEYSCSESQSVRALLRRLGIRSEFLSKDGG